MCFCRKPCGCLPWNYSERPCHSGKVVLCYRPKRSKPWCKVASTNAVLGIIQAEKAWYAVKHPEKVQMIRLLAPTWLSPSHLSCHSSGGAHVWPPKGPRAASSLENTARAPSSALSQRTTNANTRAAGERAMRPLQALAGQEIAERQCSSSGRGRGLATAWGHLQLGSASQQTARFACSLQPRGEFCFISQIARLGNQKAGEERRTRKPLCLRELH